MPATVSVNMRTVVHAKSNGICMAFPDVCKTPGPPAPFVPIPYPNIAMSKDTSEGSTTVKCDGNPVMLEGSKFSTSTGDEAGTAGGGMVSNTTKGKAEFKMFSMDVKFDGKKVPRLLDIMVCNQLSSPNTPPFPLMQPPSIVVMVPAPETSTPPSLTKFDMPDGEQKKVGG